MSLLLAIDDLTISYRTTGRGTGAGRVVAADGVGLSVGAGEVLAVVGESGSGKSTTAHAIVGLLPAAARIESGVIDFDGEDLARLPERRWRGVRGVRIGLIPQDPLTALNPVVRIGDQIAEVLRVHRLADRASARRSAVDALDLAGVDRPEIRARQFPHELSGGMRQRALIAMAMVADPALLIADEPTSALDVTVQRRILDRIEEITHRLGTGVVLITHDLAVAAERAQRIVVMRAGRVVETGPAARLLGGPEHPYTEQLIKAAPSLNSVAVPERPRDAAERPVLLELREVTKDFALPGPAGTVRAADRVDLIVRRGETFALVGESGSGKSTLARIAVRLEQPTSGSVIFDGTDLTRLRGEALRRQRRRFQLIYQNPYASLDPRLTVAELIMEPLRAFGLGDRAAQRRRAADLLDRVELPADFGRRRPAELSGGQRQRVAIARALAPKPELVVCDEPTSALDVSVQATILDLLAELQSELGLSLLFISHDLAVVRQIAHRVGVLSRGVLVETGPVRRIFEQPQHPYTTELLAAIPGGDSERGELVRGR
ncbi:dipeptide ABC transporter ATP-binding protein [Microlunatus sp. GCM10028923]|uniref:dipeptide ABC transporter ATP-binding protein n=1 Tax=Microlunatus sp. GCM10028923 TaxID=3273400 RepID=UPI003609B099